MFTELMPVLKDRIVTITIARLNESLLRVNVLPKRKPDKEIAAAENALLAPLTVTATAEELDREFAGQVLSFSGSYERAACNIREIEKAHAAGVKAAEEEQKNAKGKKPSTTSSARTASQAQGALTLPADGKPVFGNKVQCPPAPASQSWFEPTPGSHPLFSFSCQFLCTSRVRMRN
jgi:PRTRC genetic system protein E